MTNADTILTQCLANQQARLRELIAVGRPYVWELRLSLDDFMQLETAMANSIASHGGDYHHLLTKDFAIVVVMYLAEWYKRYYKGDDTMDDNKVLQLTTEELKTLYHLAGIDDRTFVYNASKNPDKKSYRWLESLQVLGGLAVQAELKRDQNDPLLPQLCKIFHGEDIDLDNLKDRNRAVALQESIARKHSLYEYLDCILNKDKPLPFAPSDLHNEETSIPQFLHRIQDADEKAIRDKFDFDWIIIYTASRNQMVRHPFTQMNADFLNHFESLLADYRQMCGIANGQIEAQNIHFEGKVYEPDNLPIEPLKKQLDKEITAVKEIDQNVYLYMQSKYEKLFSLLRYLQ